MNAGQHAGKSSSGALRSFVGLLVALSLIFGFSWLLRHYVIQGYSIPSGSMETTIMTGDTVFSEKVSYYFSDIEQGDIVTFKDPEIPNRVLIKRCIAVGGQTVDLIDGGVYIDGVLLDEPYTHGLPSYPLDRNLGPLEYPYTVPAGELWLMGDNRTNSQDSRYFGSVPEESVYGRAFMVYWPLEHIGSLN